MKMEGKQRKFIPYAGIVPLVAIMLCLRHDDLNAIALLEYAILLIFGYIAAWQDYKKRIVPNKLVLAMLSAWVLLRVPQLFWSTDRAVAEVVAALAGAILAGVLFLILYLVSRHGIGGGDVKFMTVAGLYLKLGSVLPAILWGAVLAAAAGMILILSKKMKRDDKIPLIPFLYVGIVCVVFVR